MTPNRTNVLCLLLAVAGLSFGIGQSVPADAGSPNARVLRKLDRLQNQNRLLNGKLSTIQRSLSSRNLVTGTPSGIEPTVNQINNKLGSGFGSNATVLPSLNRIEDDIRNVCVALRAGNC